MTARLALVALLLAAPAAADEIRCAVAANFAGCLQEIATAFEDETGHTVVISSGSTGSHFAQIRQGAPFDLFFAADAERPRRLEQEGLAVPGSRATYATGRLVLWIRSEIPDGAADLATALDQPGLEILAVADPRLAPYGRAARQVLDRVAPSRKGRLVTGRNVAQAWQFVASGNAQAGLVARSQIPAAGPPSGSILTVPAGLHDPIEQQMVLLSGAPEAAARLHEFVLTGPGNTIIRACGYETEPTP
jgi:molybdate transport system substrate-binding protein